MPDVAVVVPDVAVVTQLRLSAIFAVALIFFSDARRGCAFLAAFF